MSDIDIPATDPFLEADLDSDSDHELVWVRDAHGRLSRIEGLPAEMRLHVLASMPDLETLHSAVRSSRTMHETYQVHRTEILRGCLKTILGGFALDAFAAKQSLPVRLSLLDLENRTINGEVVRTNTMIETFLNTYDSWVAGTTRCPDIDDWPEFTLIDLAKYHVTVIRPLFRAYTAWALQNLWKSTPVSRSRALGKLSRSEEIRVFRALYRHAIYNNLFGYTGKQRVGQYTGEFELNQMFFHRFDPWESEAIVCIEQWVRHAYHAIYKDTALDMQGRATTMDMRHRYGDYRAFMLSTTTNSAMITARIFKLSRRHADREALLQELEDHLYHSRDLGNEVTGLCRVVSEQAQTHRRPTDVKYNNTERDQAHTRGDAMVFDGDYVPPNEPPLGWVLLWSEVYHNRYGECTPEGPQKWGYVMWDEKRWGSDVEGVRGMITNQWGGYNRNTAGDRWRVEGW